MYFQIEKVNVSFAAILNVKRQLKYSLLPITTKSTKSNAHHALAWWKHGAITANQNPNKKKKKSNMIAY